MPWADVSYTEARAACVAAGKRLCTAVEWFLACSGAPASSGLPTCNLTSGDGCYYPYGDSYSGNICNGKDNDGDPGKAGDQDVVLPTGSKGACVSYDNVYDMSGNLREWSNDPRSDGQAPDPDGYTARGGGYDTSFVGLACAFDLAIFPASFALPNLGFRCCSDAPP